jgi:antitoxin (DNA-binding transcriptional repressor) of toxin-antitoxin stability system
MAEAGFRRAGVRHSGHSRPTAQNDLARVLPFCQASGMIGAARQTSWHWHEVKGRARLITLDLDEVKASFEQILDDVIGGRPVTITRGGVPIARLEPVPPGQRMSTREVIEALKALRRGNSLGGLTVRELIEEGRRY